MNGRPAVLIYDADCGFCERWARRFQRLAGHGLTVEASWQVAARRPDVDPRRFQEAVALEDGDGSLTWAAEAAFGCLALNPALAWLLACYRQVPGFAAASETAYRWVARRRKTFSAGACGPAPADLGRSYTLSRWLFLFSQDPGRTLPVIPSPSLPGPGDLLADIAADPSSPSQLTSDRWRAFLYAGLLLATLLTVFAARLRLLPVPLERDEGEFAYTGQLLLKGVPPYTDAYTMKLPGVGLAYALFESLFGATASGIHLGLLLVNALSIALIWWLGRRLFDAETASASAAIYALLSLSQGVLGAFAHATQFVVPFAIAGTLLMLRARDEGRRGPALASGVLFGGAILMKQHAVLLAAFALFYLLQKTRRADTRRPWVAAALFMAGVALPLLALALWLVTAGVSHQAWFWIVLYPLKYITEVPLAQGLRILVSQVLHVSSFQAPLWTCAAVGAMLLLGSGRGQPGRAFLLEFFAFSFLSVCPGFYFRDHYFVLLLPALALLAGFAVTWTRRITPTALPEGWRVALPPLLFLILIGGGLYHERAYLFTSPPLKVSRDIYGPNPFPESPVIARYLKAHSAPTDRIAVLGSEPQIYFDADRLSATGHIYMYGLMEAQPYALPMQRQMIAEIEAHRPRFMVLVQVPSSWLMNPHSPTQLQTWVPGYLARHYHLAGIVDIFRHGTQYRWDKDAAGQAPRSPFNVTIWKRTGAA